MSHRIKNTGKRRIAVNTAQGILTLAPGKTETYENVLNLEALKLVAKVTEVEAKAEAKAPAAPAGGAPKPPSA